MDVHGACDVRLTPGADRVVEVGLVDVCNGGEKDQTFEVLKLAERLDLMQEEQGQLAALLQKWEKVFSTHKEDFERTDAVKHRIPTGDAAHIRERFRPLPPLLYKDMRALLAGMLQNGIITESSSPWAAPIVTVKKKDSSWRFSVDYRKLNAVTHKDAFPLPRIMETLTLMTQAKWFSTLELQGQVSCREGEHECRRPLSVPHSFPLSRAADNQYRRRDHVSCSGEGSKPPRPE